MTAAISNIENEIKQKVPDVFIAEYLDGIPMYYKGYKSIIDTPEKAEEIMGAGAIHSILVSYFVGLFLRNLDENQYFVLTGETGFKGEKKNLFNLDVAVYAANKLPDGQLHYEYMAVAPELVVEIDTAVENDEVTKDEYILKKTQRLLDFGAQKIIWFFSRTKKVMIAEPEKPWQIFNWNITLPAINEVDFNIYEYCQKRQYLNLFTNSD